MSQQLPLDGVRILDLTRLLPGPYATLLLGDMGAEVIKVEQPGIGDYMRAEEPKVGDDSHVFSILNRNKKSVSLDLKDDRGREAFLTLAAEADAVVEGFRPGVVDRLGIGYEAVRERNDAVVYCSVSGYGQESPYEQWAGHDVNYVGVGGLLGMTGRPDEVPTLPGLPVADFAGGMMGAYAVTVGLLKVANTGEGDYYDVSMTDVVVSWLSLYAPLAFDAGTETPARGQTQPAGKYPCYSVYETGDGEYVTLGAMEYHFWERFCEAVGLEEYANEDDHFPEGERLEEVRAAVAARFAERPLDAWLDRLDPVEIPVAPVNDLDDVWDDPQVVERGLVTHVPVAGEDVPVVDNPLRAASGNDWVRERPPALGEHSEQLLAAAGLSSAAIEEMLADGVVDVHEPSGPDR
jgi:crotonobetainyl-CoA:carnitine CoA-transferase CaiB-like acyl-CoA transferase